MRRRAGLAVLAASLALTALAALALLAALSLLALLATPARAELVEGRGICSGEATLRGDGRTVTVADGTTGTIEVPRAADVAYRGRISSARDDDMPYRGRARLDLPPPLPSVTVREWEGVTDDDSGEGTTDYELAGAVPSGLELTVDLLHTQADETCRGVYRVRVAGGSGVATAASLLLTGASGAVLVVAGRAAA